jgi:hypothetical protein
VATQPVGTCVSLVNAPTVVQPTTDAGAAVSIAAACSASRS